ncbi:hypothetical protein T492DRAFT_864079 [Pavlovales sp. CCMP2436]|nr:hypothetical protein T492DRAFT_864079 [Pavlovales sp. CCMP2436]
MEHALRTLQPSVQPSAQRVGLRDVSLPAKPYPTLAYKPIDALRAASIATPPLRLTGPRGRALASVGSLARSEPALLAGSSLPHLGLGGRLADGLACERAGGEALTPRTVGRLLAEATVARGLGRQLDGGASAGEGPEGSSDSFAALRQLHAEVGALQRSAAVVRRAAPGNDASRRILLAGLTPGPAEPAKHALLTHSAHGQSTRSVLVVEMEWREAMALTLPQTRARTAACARTLRQIAAMPSTLSSLLPELAAELEKAIYSEQAAPFEYRSDLLGLASRGRAAGPRGWGGGLGGSTQPLSPTLRGAAAPNSRRVGVLTLPADPFAAAAAAGVGPSGGYPLPWHEVAQTLAALDGEGELAALRATAAAAEGRAAAALALAEAQGERAERAEARVLALGAPVKRLRARIETLLLEVVEAEEVADERTRALVFVLASRDATSEQLVHEQNS